jgi:hypothetical protein
MSRTVSSNPKRRSSSPGTNGLTLGRGFDQLTMRWLSKIAKRKHVAVGDVIHAAIESILAKCEAEAELETKIIKM